MPKKTKQEKIIAQLRRKLVENQTIPQSTISYKLNPEKIQIQSNETPVISTSSNKNWEINSSAFLKKDLTKTLFLSIIAVSLELVLYWAWK